MTRKQAPPKGLKGLTFPLLHKAPEQGEVTRRGSLPSQTYRALFQKQGSTFPAHWPQVTAFFQKNEQSRPPLRGAEPQDCKAGWFLPRPRPWRSGDVTRAGRAQPTTFLTLRAARQLAAAPRSRGVPRVLAAAAQPPPNSGARAPKPGVAGGRAPQKAALAQGPQLQEPRYPDRERARRRPRAPGGPHSARAPVYKQGRARPSTSARSRAAPTRVPDLPLLHPTRGGGARAQGHSPLRSRPEVSWAQKQRPAPPPPPVWGVGPLSQARRFAASLPPLQPSPGDVVVAAAAAALPAGPTAPLGAPVPPSPLQDRQDFPLTAPWAPSYIQPSQPMGAECPSRDN